MSIEEMYEELVELWKVQTKCKGTINFGPNVNSFPVVLGVLYKVFNKNPSIKVLITVDKNETRNRLISYLTGTNIPENNKEFERLIGVRQIRILTIDIARTWQLNEYFDVGIIINCNVFDYMLRSIINKTKFTLVCINANTSTTNKIYELCPCVKTDIIEKLDKDLRISPVEETQIGVDIDNAADLKLLAEYDEYISQSIKIFGDFERLSLAINGEPKINMSSIEFCTQIARSNGWSENLDMSVAYDKDIDKYFNPNSLQERAKLTYDIRIKRSKLLSDNTSKLQTILEIVQQHVGKKILIISKTSDFAKQVTDYLNANIKGFCDGRRVYNACYNYHEDVDPVYALDAYGDRIKVKSGVAKGTYKILKGKAQKSLANDYFCQDLTFILSANNAPDKALSAQIDLLILTSSLCETIESYYYRLKSVYYTDNVVKAIKLYCKGTLEERYLTKEKPSSIHTIVNNCEKEIVFDENLGSAIVI